jgi:hypothetical protein
MFSKYLQYQRIAYIDIGISCSLRVCNLPQNYKPISGYPVGYVCGIYQRITYIDIRISFSLRVCNLPQNYKSILGYPVVYVCAIYHRITNRF